jgi:hypothetical protein
VVDSTGEEQASAEPDQSTNSKESPAVPKWGVLSDEEAKRPGATLLALLIEQANTSGISEKTLATEVLKISHTYYLALRAGTKPMLRLGDDVITRIAEFLGLPLVVVKLAAGQLKVEDFYQNGRIVRDYLVPAMKYIQADNKIGPYMPASLLGADADVQLFIVKLYERVTNHVLIPGGHGLEAIAKSYRDLMMGPGPEED